MHLRLNMLPLFGIFIVTLAPAAVAQDAVVERHKAEIVSKADKLFRQRYSPSGTVPMFYDKEREAGPPDGPIYWFDASYIVRLIFAREGSLARVELLPEAVLYRDPWSSISDAVELEQSEVQWFIKTADQLQPTGDPVEVHEPPDACFQSGGNLYCHDMYEKASVLEYCREQEQPDKRGWRASPKSVTIGYKQFIRGNISALRAASHDEHYAKIGPTWYGIHQFFNQELFHTAVVGSTVDLTIVGCSENDLVCEAGAP